MRVYILIIIHFIAIGIEADAQVLQIASETHLVLESDIHVVLSNSDLINEGDVHGEFGTLTIDSDAEVVLNTPNEISVDTLLIRGDSVMLGGKFEVNTLTIAENHSSFILDTTEVTINQNYDNSGNFTMLSGASLWIRAIVPKTGNQQVTVYRNTTFDSNTGKYSMVGTPVDSVGFEVLGENAQDWIFEYDQSIAYGETGVVRYVAPDADTLTPGKGYFSAFTGDENGTVVFQGQPNYKNVSVAVSYTDNVDDASSVEGFNILSNPFTCPINFDDFISANMSLLSEGSIWIWDDIASDAGGGDGANDYIVINQLGNTDSRGSSLSKWDGTVNVAQGFFIKAKENGNIVFNQSMKTHTGNDDGSFFRRAEYTPEKYLLGVSSENNSVGRNTLIGFHPEATNGHDPLYDASQLGKAYGLYTILEERQLAIQGLAVDWLENDQSMIKMGFIAEEKGTYIISLQYSAFTSEIPVYLNDLVEEKSVDITSSDYQFKSVAGEFNDRFSLSTKPNLINAVANTPDLRNHIDINIEGYTIKVQSDVAYDINIWSIEGQSLYHKRVSTSSAAFEMPSQGIYLLRVNASNTQETYKVAIGFE